ncbi:uncharacterized protein EI90DRAFT_3044019 [Cantharellus anzutake]|uniref:uncharacterized protein n=1 Tax=Cantharellus anzutake TaxID=1750568 RepID=UPI00190785C0|nr:uncharacterized protein EI90DRAFT_3044019 [Cantharellus anzutake]KAF8336890.1 hypothetical protein EI90DRAFT_3044019 [Cantharellus anzutake]
MVLGLHLSLLLGAASSVAFAVFPPVDHGWAPEAPLPPGNGRVAEPSPELPRPSQPFPLAQTRSHDCEPLPITTVVPAITTIEWTSGIPPATHPSWPHATLGGWTVINHHTTYYFAQTQYSTLLLPTPRPASAEQWIVKYKEHTHSGLTLVLPVIESANVVTKTVTRTATIIQPPQLVERHSVTTVYPPPVTIVNTITSIVTCPTPPPPPPSPPPVTVTTTQLVPTILPITEYQTKVSTVTGTKTETDLYSVVRTTTEYQTHTVTDVQYSTLTQLITEYQTATLTTTATETRPINYCPPQAYDPPCKHAEILSNWNERRFCVGHPSLTIPLSYSFPVEIIIVDAAAKTDEYMIEAVNNYDPSIVVNLGKTSEIIQNPGERCEQGDECVRKGFSWGRFTVPADSAVRVTVAKGSVWRVFYKVVRHCH